MLTEVTPKMISDNFIIRVTDKSTNESKLIAPSKYWQLVGEEREIKHFNDAYWSGLDVYTIPKQKRLKIQFVSR